MDRLDIITRDSLGASTVANDDLRPLCAFDRPSSSASGPSLVFIVDSKSRTTAVGHSARWCHVDVIVGKFVVPRLIKDGIVVFQSRLDLEDFTAFFGTCTLK